MVRLIQPLLTSLRLYVADKERTEHLRYASQVLLDCLGLDSPIAVDETPRGEAAGLSLAGELLVPAAELDAIFAALTLQRELAAGRFDRNGRFDETAIAWDTSKPCVDLLALEIAKSVVDRGYALPQTEGTFRVIISHDIDHSSTLEPVSLAMSVLQSLGLRRCNWVPFSKTISARAIDDVIQRLLTIETAHGVRAYYFMLAGPYGVRRYASRSDIRWKKARMIAAAIREAGMIIGLHGSYYARDNNGYRKEKDRLEDALGFPVICHRNHYLRFHPTRCWSQLESAGIKYDFSLGFNTRIGFRTGLTRAHRTFNPVSGRQSSVFSIPLVYMDTSLRDFAHEEILVQLRQTLKAAKENHGCVSLLFHPEIFLIDEQHWCLFRRTLEICQELGADLSGELPCVS